MPQAVTERGPTIRAGARAGRRSYLIKSIIVLALTGACFLFFLVWQRDDRAVAAERKTVEQYRVVLQAEVDKLGQLPHRVPAESDLPYPKRYRYLEDATRHYARHTEEPIIVLVSPRIPRIIKADGRVVIITENKQLRVEWMKERDFSEAWTGQIKAAEQR